MKIALLSFHNAANFGAALQAYALQKALEDQGHDCEYINYVNDSRGHAYSMKFQCMNALKHGRLDPAAKYLLGAPLMNARKRKFDSFYKAYLKTTKKVYRNSREAEALNPAYDCFVVGSDQVWNPTNNGHDTAYLLDFVKDNNKKISFASSFGVADLDEENRKRYRENLLTFQSLGVREKLGQKLVKDLTGRDSELVLDPVMLLTKEQWLGMLDDASPKEKYVFCYTNRDNQINDFFKSGYKLDGRKLYKLSRHTKPGDFLSPTIRVKYQMSPLEFIQVIEHADLVVSASFHCLAMAILLNKPFVAILTGNEGKDERLKNLLGLLGLEGRSLKAGMTPEDIAAPIDWAAVNGAIDELRKSSLAYLNGALSRV